MMPLSRRDFFSLTGGTLLSAAAGQSTTAAEVDRLWSFVVLGDLHYDRPEHHDMDFVRERYPKDIRQIEDYCRVTEQYTPRLLSEIRQVIAASSTPVRCVIQVGDLVEGLCGSKDLAVRQSREALQAVREARLGAPFLITKGNHDITGPGAIDAYHEVFLPFLAEEGTLAHQERACFTVEYDGDLFVFFDAYEKSSLDWLEKTAARWPDRRFFFVVHPPVVPYNARSNWHVYAAESQSEQRRRLLEILSRHRAIVLSGHLHKYSLVGRRLTEGRFTQFAHCGIIRADQITPKDERHGLTDYGPKLLDLEPSFSPETRERRRMLLEAERPWIDRFDYADVPGYAIVHVGRKKIEADVYVGLGQRLWKTVELS